MPKRSSKSEILQVISQSQKILLCLHPSPDGDCLGSALAFYWYLTGLGKKPTVIKGDSELPTNLKQLPGYDRIVSAKFSTTELKKFDLFISVDASAPNQITKKSELSFPLSIPTIVIDHHATNDNYGDYNFVDTSAPSTTQIIMDLFLSWKVNFTKNIAANLFLGLYTDSGGFKYSKTTPKSFRYAAKLTKIYTDFPDMIFELENNNLPQHLHFKTLAYSSIKNYFNQNLALTAISYKQLKKHNIEPRFTEKSQFSNTLKSVVGWNIGITMIESEPGVCSLSMRTRDPKHFDVSKIASSVGVGGGHPAAAGTTIRASIPKATKMLLAAIQKLHPELGNP